MFDATERYRSEGRPLIVLAGKDYGSGSSRDWAAKGPWMLVSSTPPYIVVSTFIYTFIYTNPQHTWAVSVSLCFSRCFPSLIFEKATR